MRETDEVIVERFLADLHELYPADARRDRRRDACSAGSSATSTRAPAAAACRPRSRARSAPHENLHLAGDYFAELGNMEAAARTGLAAAERVDARIREVTHV